MSEDSRDNGVVREKLNSPSAEAFGRMLEEKLQVLLDSVNPEMQVDTKDIDQALDVRDIYMDDYFNGLDSRFKELKKWWINLSIDQRSVIREFVSAFQHELNGIFANLNASSVISLHETSERYKSIKEDSALRVTTQYKGLTLGNSEDIFAIHPVHRWKERGKEKLFLFSPREFIEDISYLGIDSSFINPSEAIEAINKYISKNGVRIKKEKWEGAFVLLLKVCEMLKKIDNFYKPKNDKDGDGGDDESDDEDEVVVDHGFMRIEKRIIH